MSIALWRRGSLEGLSFGADQVRIRDPSAAEAFRNIAY